MKSAFLLAGKSHGLAGTPRDAEISDRDAPAIEQLEKIDTSKKCGFPTAGRSHHGRKFTCRKFESEILEKGVRAERFR